jgi:hypothetical protein
MYEVEDPGARKVLVDMAREGHRKAEGLAGPPPSALPGQVEVAVPGAADEGGPLG